MSHLPSSVVITTINTLSQHPSTSTSTSTSTTYSRHTFIRHITSCIMTLFIICCTQITYIHAQDCFLTVPADPLKISGLATPWILSGQGCTQTSSATQTFVQGAIIDLRSGKISIYDPLVVDAGKTFVRPDQPLINNNNIVIAYWIQTHARTITLIDAVNGVALQQANCTSGLPNSRFGKFAHCNAYAFFVAANQQVAGGQLSPPLPGKGNDKLPCPTTRDYAFLGRNAHGTVMTTYLLNPETQQIAQDTFDNRKACGFTCIVMQSDSARMINDIMFSLGCALWIAPDLADKKGGQGAAALPLNELQAANARLAPGTMALIPANDSLATVGGEPNIDKLNLVRVGLNQPWVRKLSDASTWDYCIAMSTLPQPRLAADMDLLKKYTRQGDISEANSLYTLVVKRQIELYQQLGCTNVSPVPFKVVPADWTTSAATPLQDAIPIQPSIVLPSRCQNMFIIDTKCSFLLCLIVVGGGLTLGFIFFIGLKMVQGYKNGGKSSTADATRTAIRV